MYILHEDARLEAKGRRQAEAALQQSEAWVSVRGLERMVKWSAIPVLLMQFKSSSFTLFPLSRSLLSSAFVIFITIYCVVAFCNDLALLYTHCCNGLPFLYCLSLLHISFSKDSQRGSGLVSQTAPPVDSALSTHSISVSDSVRTVRVSNMLSVLCEPCLSFGS